MRQYGLLCLLLLFICGYYGQDSSTDWNGDPNVCTVDPPGTFPPGPSLPIFSNITEFTLEQVEILHLANETSPSVLTMYRFLYNYNANKLIVVISKKGSFSVEHYYYETRKMSTYYQGQYCLVTDIPTDSGPLSAVQIGNQWHIRPLNEFLLFSSFDSRHPIIRPKYIGPNRIRGIAVDQWESCIINNITRTTERRLWSFAQKKVTMPIGDIGNLAIPVQAEIRLSDVFQDGTQAFENIEVLNVLSFRPGIIESTDQLAPPKGVFCDSGPDQNLISLEDIHIEWPERFSVRVEASTSRTDEWQRFHLRYDRGGRRNGSRVRYDYLPPGAEDFESVIHDYGDNLTYIIDRRLGSCQIHRGIDLVDVSPTRDPIRFFVRNERKFIFSPTQKSWDFHGFRSCRGNSVECTVVTSQIPQFPIMIDPDTGVPNGETWTATNVEYGWSKRTHSGRREFDYPVYLYLKLYRFADPSNPSLVNMRTEDIEYEFYEMSHETNPYDFDTSVCYRSRNLEYLHVGFTLKPSQGNMIDGNHLNRRRLEEDIHENLVRHMRIRYARVSDIIINHERNINDINILFTLLGPTPSPESPTGVDEDESSAKQARDILERVIDDGKFQFTIRLINNTIPEVQFTAEKGSLKASKQFMSPHVTGSKVVKESYTSGAQAGAIIGGILVGLLIGVLLAALVRIIRNDPMPDVPGSISNPLPSISYYNKKPTSDDTKTTTDA